MKCEMTQNGKELTVKVEGRLDTATAPELQEKLIPQLKEIDHLILDFSDLQYISSAGLRVVLMAHRSIAMGGTTEATHCNSVVKEVFEITGLTDVIRVS